MNQTPCSRCAENGHPKNGPCYHRFGCIPQHRGAIRPPHWTDALGEIFPDGIISEGKQKEGAAE